MKRTIRSAVVVALLGIIGSASAGSFDPGDGRNLSEEQLKIFEMRAAQPVSPEAAALEAWYQEQSARKHGSIDD